MVEVPNSNGTGEFATKKGKEAWRRAEKKAGAQFLQRIQSPEADPFYAYSDFCRQRRYWALSHGVTNPDDIEVVLSMSKRDISNNTSHQRSLNDATLLQGITNIETEARRIAEMFKPKKRPAGTAALN